MQAEENRIIEYSHPAKERFREEGRIFLVDYSKACAAETVLSILQDAAPSSFLMIAENETSAEDYGERLRAALGEVKVITSYSDFVRMVGFDPNDYARASAAAAKLAEKHKNVIISVTDEKGAPLLHKKLCKNAVVGGTFAGQYDAAYCVSDMLGEGGYEMVAVDAVYSAFALNASAEEKQPGNFDLVTFFGKMYYSDTEHSFKRLERLVCAAQKKILISEVAFRDDVVNLYAALRLINNEFSLIQMRSKMKSGQFREHCENISTAFSYFCSDDSYISECMQKLRGLSGYVPEDLRSMDRYFANELSYISNEEKLLRCAFSVKNIHFHGAETSLDAIMGVLMESPDNLTDCILDMFFGETIKERMEGSISDSLACKLSGADFDALFHILLEFGGVYHYLSGKDSQTKVFRFLRDDSGFEYFVRRRSKFLKTDTYSYSVVGKAGIDVYKCAEIARLADAGELSFPVLILVESNAVAFADRLSKNLGGGYSVTCGHASSQGKRNDEKSFVIYDADAFKATAKDVKISSMILYHVLPDVFEIRRFVNKSLSYGAENVIILADYGNLSAHMMDYWQSVLFDGSVYFPFENASITMKENVLEDYRVAVKRIEEEYRLLSTIVRGGQYADVQTFAKRFGTLLLDYTLLGKGSEETIMADVEYLAKVGYHYEAIFANTCTIGDEGDRVVRKKLYYEKTGEGKSEKTEVMTEELERNTIFFNACSKRLCSGCDFLHENCADCPDAKIFIHNDVSELVTHTKEFFKKTLKYDEKIEEDKLKGGLLSTISFDYADEEEEDELVASQIVEWRKDAELALKTIQEYSDQASGGIFICDYALAARVRDAVYKTYRKMIRKYYITLRDLFDSSTKKAIAACRASLEQKVIAHDDK